MPKFAFTDEQQLLGETVRDLLDTVAPIEEVRCLDGDATGYTAVNWRRIAVDLGLAGLLVPESSGGVGGTLTDAAVVLEEMGAALYNGPFLASSVLAPLVLGCADQDVDDLLASVAEGAVFATTSLHDGPLVDDWSVGVTADLTGEGWRLCGEATGVLHGWAATRLLVVARAAGGLGVWAIETDHPGHSATPLATLDLTRAQSSHVLREVPGRMVVAPDPEASALRRAALLAAVAVTAEQVGGARRLLDRSVRHVVDRYQFGRSLGSFQAIKHRCVDMAALVEGSTSLSRNAFAAVATEGAALAGAVDPAEDVHIAGPAAASYCSESYLQCAGWALQLHGGTGMAWEHDSHLYLRRAKVLDRLFGTPVDHRRMLISAFDLAS
ncbi:acyl-CoA dehydrogenase family protein [Nocardia sp. NPDC052278]|uniref:acyl-CoA dehydrogenase family protein n=1 Tax=unclassified Nocardia TaxID=2637762 RepID=UPI0036B7B28D